MSALPFAPLPQPHGPLAQAVAGEAIEALSLQPAPGGAVLLLVSDRRGDDPCVIHVHALLADGTAPASSAKPVTVTMQGHLTPPQMYPPQWAAAPWPNGAWSVAVTEPGGASSPLLHWRSDQPRATAMSRTDVFRAFSAPRAVRHRPGPPAFVAIESRPDGTSVVTLFSPGTDGTWTEHALAQGPSIAEAVLLPHGQGWLLLHKTADGAGAAEATRSRPRRPIGEATLGQVHGQRLDAQFKPVAPPFLLSPPGAAPMYEFDADLAGEQFVVLGTTPSGYSLAQWRLTAEEIVLEKHADAALAAPTGAPSVLLQAGAVHAALVEGIGTAAGRVVYGRW